MAIGDRLQAAHGGVVSFVTVDVAVAQSTDLGKDVDDNEAAEGMLLKPLIEESQPPSSRRGQAVSK